VVGELVNCSCEELGTVSKVYVMPEILLNILACQRKDGKRKDSRSIKQGIRVRTEPKKIRGSGRCKGRGGEEVAEEDSQGMEMEMEIRYGNPWVEGLGAIGRRFEGKTALVHGRLSNQNL